MLFQTRTLLVALSLAGAVILLFRLEYKTSAICHNVNGYLSFSGIPGPIFSSRTRIITRTRLLYSDTNLNRIRIAAVGSDLFQVGSQRNRAQFKVIGSELF